MPSVNVLFYFVIMFSFSFLRKTQGLGIILPYQRHFQSKFTFTRAFLSQDRSNESLYTKQSNSADSLLRELKEWRKRTADELQRPIFRIMSNQLLEDIARMRPRTIDRLSLMNGVGPFTIRQYGKKVINIVQKYAGETEEVTPQTDIHPGIDTDAFWDNIRAKKKPKVSKKAPSKSEAEKEAKKKVLAANKAKRKQLQVMTEDAIAEMEAESIMDIEELNEEQQKAAAHILKGHNVFVTGSAGTGKSYLLRYVIQELLTKHGDEGVAVTAPTGIAAININGMTVHSFAGIGIGNGDKEKVLKKVFGSKTTVERWVKCKVLIIDEISMLDRSLFELLDEIARATRGNDKPFGGLQLIVVGDFMQLPPVQNKESSVENSGFCFESHVWEACGLRASKGSVNLQTVVRQSDENFVKYLNEVRLGVYSREFHQQLQKCLTSIKPLPTNGIVPTKLYAVNKQVDEENNRQLAALPGDIVTLVAEDKWKFAPTKVSVQDLILAGIENTIPEKIDLKIGSQVMLLRNRSRMTYGGVIKQTGPSLVNGSRGKIVGFSESVLKPGFLVPTVLFDNGMVVTIGPVEYSYKIPGLEGEIVRQQIPLKLAWAATVHKSQGCTLTCAELMLDRVFDYGQAYVALSRVKNLEGLWMSAPLHSKLVKAHPSVLRFYGYRNDE